MRTEVIGIDVSKKSLDVAIHGKSEQIQVVNNLEGFQEILSWIKKSGVSLKQVTFCFEHTGLYSLHLAQFLTESGLKFYLVSGLRVKRSLGLVRGKNDQIDARNLARFGHLFAEELTVYQMPEKIIIRLRDLMACRAKLVRQASAHKISLRGYKQQYAEDDIIVQLTKEQIANLQIAIKQIEKEVKSLVELDPILSGTYKNICSIPGVGMVLAVNMIIKTNNFQNFNSWRAFACYCGTAPFENQSGISLRGKTKISSLGDRTMKTLLTQSAATSIQFNPEMREYYLRRLEEGKNKMSTLNIIRNKILGRIFAVASRQTPYVDLKKYAA